MSHDTDLADLERSLSGDVLRPGSAEYEQARKPRQARFHGAHPQAIVLCASPGDVAETISWSRRLGVPVTARSGGHCHAGRSTTDGVVIDVTPMRTVAVSHGVATVGAGVRLGELYDQLHGHHVALPAGCGDSVGIAGLTLGGGIGILGRMYGLTCDQLLTAQVVLADGRIVDCDNGRHERLFWALRGAGGGQFGIVTRLVFRVVPAPDATAFELSWPYRHAQALIDAWQTWAPNAPDEVSASLRLRTTGTGSPTVSMFGAVIAAKGTTERMLEELIVASGAEPLSASMIESSYRDAKRALTGLDGDPTIGPERHELMWSAASFFRRPLPSSATAALLRALTHAQRPDQSRELVFTPMGGAYNRISADATAFVHRHEQFLLDHAATVPSHTPDSARGTAHGWTARSSATTYPWASGAYANFPNPEIVDWADAYHGDNYAALLAIKREYDPDNVFSFHQSLRS
jgi:FAD binding domain/Berberine and berberine like